MRLNPIVLYADLQKMFHQVGYRTEANPRTKMQNNRDLYRLLWTSHKHNVPKVYRFCKLLLGCTCSPFQANNVIDHHLNHLIETSTDAKVVKASHLLKEMMYIDDVILALKSVNEAIEIRETITNIFKEMVMKRNQIFVK